MNRLRKQYGFTLIELMVVVGIIVLLSTMMMVNYRNASRKARDSRRAADLEQLRSALEIYYADNDSYPDAMNEASLGKLSFEDNEGNVYSYHPTGTTGNIHVYSICTTGWEGSVIPVQNQIPNCGADQYGVISP